MLLDLCYAAALLCVSPWLCYRAWRHGKYRRGWRSKLWGRIELPAKTGNRIWLHAVSVGEVNLLKGLTRALGELAPGVEWVVSTTTATGFELARRHFPPERVFYSPLDFSWAVRRAVRNVDADLIVLTELEIWPNWIAAARRRGIPVAVINGRLSHRSHRRYRRVRWWIAKTFARLSLVAVQDQAYAARFLDLGVPPEAVRVTGSLKFDDAPLDADPQRIAALRQWCGASAEHRIWVAGSTQTGEEAIVLRVFQRLGEDFPELRLVLVPRHAERFDEVAAIIRQHELGVDRRSEREEPTPQWPADRVLLIDTIGELREWWGLAEVAFVGGSFGDRGGQNMLEPAAYGAAVGFGPNTHNFRDIVDRLLAEQAAVQLRDEDELEQFVRHILADREAAAGMGLRARSLIGRQRGATARTIEALLPLLPRPTGSREASTQSAGVC
jgi:3-deoxy-D-manno-octulosonic-acid transferase